MHRQFLKRLVFAAAVLLSLPSPGRADAGLGTRVPLPTAASQIALSSLTAPFNWQAVNVFNISGSPGDYTVTFGGPLVVSPTGTAENGLTVTMPSGATGYGYALYSSTRVLLFDVPAAGYLYAQSVTVPYSVTAATVTASGSITAPLIRPVYVSGNNAAGNAMVLSGGQGNGTGAGGDLVFYTVPAIASTSYNANTGQSQALRISGATNLATFSAGVNSPAYQVGGTAGYTGTIPNTFQSLNVHSGVITGYLNSAGTQVGNP